MQKTASRRTRAAITNVISTVLCFLLRLPTNITSLAISSLFWICYLLVSLLLSPLHASPHLEKLIHQPSVLQVLYLFPHGGEFANFGRSLKGDQCHEEGCEALRQPQNPTTSGYDSSGSTSKVKWFQHFQHINITTSI